MKFTNDLGLFSRDILLMMRSQIFIGLTILGNTLITMSAMAFYFLEKDVNPKMQHFLDAVWWSYATATTTGYGDITPMTDFGKILGILVMLMGTALFAMYTGLFADVILGHARSRH